MFSMTTLMYSRGYDFSRLMLRTRLLFWKCCGGLKAEGICCEEEVELTWARALTDSSNAAAQLRMYMLCEWTMVQSPMGQAWASGFGQSGIELEARTIHLVLVGAPFLNLALGQPPLLQSLPRYDGMILH